MDAIEKRARELLAAQFNPEGREQFERGQAVVVTTAGALNAIAAALTPPVGYVLVNHTQLRQLLRDAVTASDFVGGRAQSKPLARRLADQAWALIETPAGTVRPEVP